MDMVCPHSSSYNGNVWFDGPRRKNRSLSTPNWLKLTSGAMHFNVMRNTAAAPAAAGLAGATMGRPDRRTFSTSIGHSVTAEVDR